MTDAVILFLIAQSLSIIAAVAIAYMRTQVAVAEIQAKLSALDAKVSSLKIDHATMGDKVDGISRHVAIIEGMELQKAKSAQDFRRASPEASNG